MFKIFKKLYFKFYHLIKFLGIFILIFGLNNRVYADECTNLIVNGQDWLKSSSGNFILNNTGQNTYITLEPETQYTIFFDYGEKNFNEIINTSTAVSNFQIWHKYIFGFEALHTVDLTQKSYTFTSQILGSGDNLQYYFRMNGISGNTATTPFIDNEEHEFWLVKGTEVCRTRPEPEPEKNVYTDFLTIYTDRISYLANGFNENPYLLAMVGIIFAWIVLELFLHIFHLKGGYKK